MNEEPKALTVYKSSKKSWLGRSLEHLRDKQTNPWYGYGFALFFSFIGLAIIFLLRIAFDAERLSLFLLLFPLTTFSSLYGGFRAGVLTTLLLAGSLIGLYSYQYHTLDTFPMWSAIQVTVFVLESIFISFLIDKVKRFNILSKYAAREALHKKAFFQLSQQYMKARKDIQARDEFLSMVSHELKAPLTSMLLQSQMAMHNIKSVSLANFSIERLLKTLENSETQIKQLAKMVNDLMNVSLITTGKLPLEKEEMDLSEIVKAVISQQEDKAEQEGSKLTLHTDHKVIGVWDKVRIEQVITNLITNAIKYGDGKPIEVTVAGNGTAILTVKDQGIGMSSDVQKRIFNRFERGVIGNEYEGLGVGLYITEQIVKAHSGKISVSSKLKKGTTFTVELPLNK